MDLFSPLLNFIYVCIVYIFYTGAARLPGVLAGAAQDLQRGAHAPAALEQVR